MEKHKTTTHDELEKIKKEILDEKNSAKGKKLPWGSVTVTCVLVLLAAISITQAVQSASILSKIKSNAIKPASAGISDSASSPSSLDKLPNMVGGC